MKILHTADWHLGKKLMDFSRLAEQAEALDQLCEIAEVEAVDVVIIAGDLFDSFNPPNEAIDLFYKTLHRLSDQGKRAVVGIAGNHDSAERIEAPDPLARECGIFLSGFPLTKVPSIALESGVATLRTDAGFLELRLPQYAYPLRLLLTPYASEARLKTLFNVEKEESTATFLKEHWHKTANRYCDSQGVNLLVAHLFMMDRQGIKPDEPEDERHILHLGGAEPIYTDFIPGQVQYTALGHLHRNQLIKGHAHAVMYSGSLLEYSFSEAYQEKFVLILEVEPAQKAMIRKVPITAGKPLHRLRFEKVSDALSWLKENPNTYVELTLLTDSFLDASVKRDLYEAHAGIVAIIPEMKQVGGEAEKGQAIDLQKSVEELFEQYFTAREQKPLNDELRNLFKEILHSAV